MCRKQILRGELWVCFSISFICNNNTVLLCCRLSFSVSKIALGLPFYSFKMWNKLLVFSAAWLQNEVSGVPNTLSCFLTQVPKWEGDNQLCRIYCFSTALFPEWRSSCPAPLQSLLLTHGCMTSPTPPWPPMAMTSLEQMPPLPGPVTFITAPFYDASFRCQVCLQLTEGGGVTSNETELEGPKPYLSLSSVWGSVGLGLLHD